MKYAVIKDNICVNLIMASEEYADRIGAVEIPAGFGIGDIYQDGVWSKPEHPEPEPTMDERVDALEDALAQTDEVAVELFEANLEQAEINTMQDEALVEFYEMLG